jgi:microcystin-dependent protein
MTTVTGLTADRMLAIEAASVVAGAVNAGGDLILTKHDGNTMNAGHVVGAVGPAGPAGPPGFGAIPGEIRMWPGSVLPAQGTYGKWVWADGGVYASATYPQASGNIAAEWRTFGGSSDPGAGNFRVPDLRGLTPVGLDAMPGGARANRMTRAVAIVIAGRTGEETHVITVAEMANHSHNINDPGHAHTAPGDPDNYSAAGFQSFALSDHTPAMDGYVRFSGTGITIQSNGGGNAHENLQPTVFIPYIVCLTG